MGKKTSKAEPETEVHEEQMAQVATAPDDEAQAAPTEDTTLPEDTVAVDHPSGLNLREGPGFSFQILTVLPDGAQLAVLQLPGGAEVPGYALVRYEGGEDGPLVGWVNTSYIRED